MYTSLKMINTFFSVVQCIQGSDILHLRLLDWYNFHVYCA